MNRKYLIIILLCILIMPIIPIGQNMPIDKETIYPVNINKESGVTAEALYNVTSVDIIYGHNTTNMLESKEMDIIDNTNASFIEDKYIGSVDVMLGDSYTDSIDYWTLIDRFSNLQTIDDAYVGTTSIRARFTSSTATPTLRFDNNTANVANISVIDMSNFNISIKASENGSVLSYIAFYHSSGVYFLASINVSVTTSWAAHDYPINNFVSVGGMSKDQVINWIDFAYTSPQTGRWMYIDAPSFYSSNVTRRLDVEFNFASIAPFEHYALNITAATNVTEENMRIVNNLNPTEVSDLSGTDIWEDYSIVLNATVIQLSGYLQFLIFSTLLDDAYNSTLDIDLFQIYAWNETSKTPSIQACYIPNIEPDNTMYAGYRNYTIVENTTDENGYADLSYIRFGLETSSNELLWAVGWFEDNNTFVKEIYPDPTMVTLRPELCSNISSGNTVSVTFVVMINILHQSRYGINLFAFANDTGGLYFEYHYNVGYNVEVGVTIENYHLSDDRGNPNQTLFFAGDAHYTNSNLTLNAQMYDLWVTNDQGLLYSARAALDEATYGCIFNITDIPTPLTVGEYIYQVGAKKEGDDGTGPFYYDYYQDTYIVDNMFITLTAGEVDATNGNNILVSISAIYEYDNMPCISFTAVIAWNGLAISGTYNYGDVISLKNYDTTGVLTIDSFTDNTYGITSFTSNSLTLSWEGGGSGNPTTSDDENKNTNPIITNTIDWGIIIVVVICLGYVSIFGIGDIKGLGGKTAFKYRNEFIKGFRRNIKISKRAYKSTTSDLSSRLPSGKRLGSYKIKLPTTWRTPSKGVSTGKQKIARKRRKK